jgi:hypothetical protein
MLHMDKICQNCAMDDYMALYLSTSNMETNDKFTKDRKPET